MLANAEAGTSEPLGATPIELVIVDSSERGPQLPPASEVLGAAPIAILPGSASSDGELSTDAVEIVTGTTEDGASAPTTPPASRPDQARADGTALGSAAVGPPPSAPSGEPREVDLDVVEMVESNEHLTAATPVPPTKPRAVPAPNARPDGITVTPPPLPPDVAAMHSPVPSPPLAAPAASDGPAVTPPPLPPVVTAAHAPPATAITAALFDEVQSPAPGEQIPEALARRSLQKRTKPWYEEVFDEDFLRTLPFSTPAQTKREVDFIRDSLAPPRGGEILDVACGYGRHALELAQQGFRVTGLDLSLPLLIRAADEVQRRGFSVNFVHADMREMTFNSQFDAAYCMLSSFGYFDEDTNLKVASAVCRALKPGGRFLLDIVNRDYIVGDLPSRVWWEGDGCVVLEEVDFNFHTSRVLVRRSVVFGNGRQSEQEISLRAYSLHEVGKLLRQAGLRVLQVSGGLATRSKFFGASSRNIIVLCERPAA